MQFNDLLSIAPNLDLEEISKKLSTPDGYFAIAAGIAATVAWFLITWLLKILKNGMVLAGQGFISANRWTTNRDRRFGFEGYWAAYKSVNGLAMLEWWGRKNFRRTLFCFVATVQFSTISLLKSKMMSDHEAGVQALLLLFWFGFLTFSRHYMIDEIMIGNAIKLRSHPEKIKGRSRARRRLPTLTK